MTDLRHLHTPCKARSRGAVRRTDHAERASSATTCCADALRRPNPASSAAPATPARTAWSSWSASALGVQLWEICSPAAPNRRPGGARHAGLKPPCRLYGPRSDREGHRPFQAGLTGRSRDGKGRVHRREACCAARQDTSLRRRVGLELTGAKRKSLTAGAASPRCRQKSAVSRAVPGHPLSAWQPGNGLRRSGLRGGMGP